MNNSIQKIDLLKRIVYLLVSLLIISITTNAFLYLNPKTIIEKIESKSVSWSMKSLVTDIPSGEEGKNIRYGYQLIINTSKHIGPMSDYRSMRFAGNNLTCNNCHLLAGRKIGSGSFVGVTNRFPQFRGRENKIGTLEERINGCFERSMNGSALTVDSKEMQAMISYMSWLSEGVPEEIEEIYKGYVKIIIPNKKANTVRGQELYNAKCERCHLKNGSGIQKLGNNFNGYIYPPLGGNDTYNDGAGMNRVITAAEFIKGNMPFGATYDSPQVTDEEAYNIAAYINTFSRPNKKNKVADFPNKKLKPVSTPYGPWEDNFSAEQHKFGPFQPIISFYKKEYDITKTK